MSEPEKMVLAAKHKIHPDGRMVDELSGDVITFAEIQAASLMGLPMDTRQGYTEVHHYANKLIELAERVKSSRATAAMRSHR